MRSGSKWIGVALLAAACCGCGQKPDAAPGPQASKWSAAPAEPAFRPTPQPESRKGPARTADTSSFEPSIQPPAPADFGPEPVDWGSEPTAASPKRLSPPSPEPAMADLPRRAAPLASSLASSPMPLSVRPLMSMAPRQSLRSMHLAPAPITPLRPMYAPEPVVEVPLAPAPAPTPMLASAPAPDPTELAEEAPEPSAGEPVAEADSPSPALDAPAAPAAAGALAATGAAPAGSEDFDRVRLFYATDRGEVTAESKRPSWSVALCVAGIAAGCYLMAWSMGRSTRSWFSFAGHAALLVAVGLAGYSAVLWHRADELRANSRIVYGNDRGPLQMGVCEVTIPKSHQVGIVESPSILRMEVRHDKQRHIVLDRVDRLEPDAFHVRLREAVLTAGRREVFVFVHGYNVEFDEAARRTAQLAFDLDYQGTPICYSWPSQGGLLKYTIDETNVVWTVPHLKQFLLDVVANSGADAVNVVAHSMGSRAVTAALRELALERGDAARMLGKVVLAAPDVDAEVFRQMAPDIARTAHHVTLYASSNDQALIASKRVHGYPRAGESGSHMVIVPGVETIDVSSIDTSVLGHSYYGDSGSILTDLYHLVIQSLPARERRWLQPRSHDGLTYWVFHQLGDTPSVTSRVARSPEPVLDR